MASECFVYFIQSGNDGPVKIGTAACVKTRIGQLQTGNPVDLILLLTLPGSEDEERAFHDQFAALFIRGEWFRFEGDLKEFLEANSCGAIHRNHPREMSSYRRLKAKYPDEMANGASYFRLMLKERSDRRAEIDRISPTDEGQVRHG